MMQKNLQKRVDSQPPKRLTYSSPVDFCEMFDEHMDELYSLALLLTGEHTAAEACFLGALDDCCKSTDVFRVKALSWSRRAILKDAIRRLHPALTSHQHATTTPTFSTPSGALSRVLSLQTLERLVFAMSVLEGYSIQECAALLDCSPRDVTHARVRALQSLGAEENVPLLRQTILKPQAMPAVGAA